MRKFGNVAMDRGMMHGRGRNAGWPGGMGVQRVARAGERSEWAKSTHMVITMWPALSADGLKLRFSSRKDALIFTVMSDLDRRTAE